MKKYNSYADLDRETDGLYEKGMFKEALDGFLQGLETLPKKELDENLFVTIWNKAVLYTKCDEFDECFDLIKSTVEDRFAFPIQFKRFEPLMKRFEDAGIVEKNQLLLSELNSKTKAKHEVHLPQNYDPSKRYPLVIALHGDGMCSIQEFSQYWTPKVCQSKDIIFAYVQSSQVICHNGYGWQEDLAKSRGDIKQSYEAIKKDYLIDEENVILSGFSGGAIATIDCVMSHEFDIKGFVVVSPEEKTEAFTLENVSLAAKKGIKGVLMEGEFVLPMQQEDEMMQTFEQVGLEYQYIINKDVGHAVPMDFDVKLDSAIDYIMG